MNREIKFRAWHKAHNEMVEWTTINQSAFNRDTTHLLYHILVAENTLYSIMQYTGLKDKNGVEIYEGDIMGWECYEGTKHQVRWVVEYNINQGFKTWSSTKNDEIVIGNIYENPELLK